MNLKLIGAALLALAVVATGAAAAAPGNVPVDVPTDNDDGEADAPDAAGDVADGNVSDNPADMGAGNAAEQRDRHGPPADLPSQVPDFMSQIHDLVRQHLNGALDGVLGHHVSDVTPDDDQAGNAGNGGAAGTDAA